MVDVNSNKNGGVKEAMDQAFSTLQTIFSYFLLPVALPFVFFQECLTWFREKVGLNKRSMEGKVCKTWISCNTRKNWKIWWKLKKKHLYFRLCS